MNARRIAMIVMGALLVAFAACRAANETSGDGGVAHKAQPDGTPPVLSTIPEFTFTSQANAPFGSAQLAGKPWIANFIFTRCPTACPIFTAKMKDVQDRAKLARLDLKLVSFSVDPENDTPGVLAEYATAHEADPAMWSFLTGDPEKIRESVVNGLKVAAEPIGKDQDLASVFHGSHFVLVDAQNRIRGYYDSADADATDRLLTDLTRL